MLDIGEPAKNKDGRVPRYRRSRQVEICDTKLYVAEWNLIATADGAEARKVLRSASEGKITYDSAEFIEATLHLVWLSVHLENPDISEAYLAEELTPADLGELLVHVLKVNRMLPETAEPGEAKAGSELPATPTPTMTPLPNGLSSSPLFAESSAGPGNTPPTS
jgi:hypothetical protein